MITEKISKRSSVNKEEKCLWISCVKIHEIHNQSRVAPEFKTKNAHKIRSPNCSEKPDESKS